MVFKYSGRLVVDYKKNAENLKNQLSYWILKVISFAFFSNLGSEPLWRKIFFGSTVAFPASFDTLIHCCWKLGTPEETFFHPWKSLLQEFLVDSAVTPNFRKNVSGHHNNIFFELLTMLGCFKGWKLSYLLLWRQCHHFLGGKLQNLLFFCFFLVSIRHNFHHFYHHNMTRTYDMCWSPWCMFYRISWWINRHF